MFEDLTFDNIMEEMMEDAEEGVSIIEGSFYYAACSKLALEIERLVPRLESLNDNLYIDTQEEDILIANGKEAGIPIEEAEAAIFKAQFNCPVTENARFSHIDEEYNYYVLDAIDEATHIYRMECEEVGIKPSHYLGDIEPITTDDEPEGFEWGKLVEVLYQGRDQEDTEDYRFRRVEYFGTKAFAGNRAYYQQEIGALNGVGAVKINRKRDGEETLIAVIANESFSAPTDDVLTELQNLIDPEPKGEGLGIAPVEHVVQVIPVDEAIINVSTKVTMDDGIFAVDIKDQVDTIIESYLKELAKTWQDVSRMIVVRSQIEARILDIEGVLDVYETTLNGLAQNLMLGEYEVPKKGVVIVV